MSANDLGYENRNLKIHRVNLVDINETDEGPHINIGDEVAGPFSEEFRAAEEFRSRLRLFER